MAYTSHVDVLLILTNGNGHILLALRQGTGYCDGQYNVPSGKLEDGETALDAVVREAREEIGLTLTTGELRHVATVHCRNPQGQRRLGLFFTVEHDPARHGEPVNAEPDKCAKIEWFPADTLPDNTVPYTTAGITLMRSGATFGLVEWNDD
ncbi:MAG: NUDIX hydrolase [Pseudonocardiales bacterium]